MYFFPYLELVHYSMSSCNCCFLTCIQISQEAGQVVWYSHLFKNIPQFVVIHIKTLAWSMKQNQNNISKTGGIPLARPAPPQQDVAGTHRAGV